MGYDPKTYRTNGGDTQVVASGGTLDVQDGATLSLGDIDYTIGTHVFPKTVKVALAAATGNAGVLSWQNPEAVAILVTSVILDITTEATGAANVDVGTDGDGTGTSDTIIDGADIGSAAIVLNNHEDQGTNGQAVVKLDAAGGTTDYITATASADPAGLVGSAYITYIPVTP